MIILKRIRIKELRINEVGENVEVNDDASNQ